MCMYIRRHTGDVACRSHCSTSPYIFIEALLCELGIDKSGNVGFSQVLIFIILNTVILHLLQTFFFKSSYKCVSILVGISPDTHFSFLFAILPNAHIFACNFPSYDAFLHVKFANMHFLMHICPYYVHFVSG